MVNSQRKLFFQNTKSKIHPSFKLGGDNVLELSPDVSFDIAENVTLNSHNFITVKNGAHLKIGKETYITRATISCLGEIEIGENCILGEGLKMFDHNHQYAKHPFSVSKTDFNINKIKMGNNVWTGANVTILKGVTIGNNCIIGTGVLVYKDVPENSILKLKQELILQSL
jgi:acetyltransferase-like isoleucine patch superfamily enzyme